MKKIKILLIFGTRPEAIKMAPLVQEFIKNKEYFDIKTCVTAQHREMLDQVLNIFNIRPDFDLNIMKESQDLYDISSNILLKIRVVLNEFKPNIVLVHGDTTTALISALSAFYERITIGHIEAGLRTGNKYSPFPEEMNRKLITQLVEYHFAPTELSKNNLIMENIKDEKILVTGNTVIDAMNIVLDGIKNDLIKQDIIKNVIENKGYKISNKKIILVTGHRRENFGIGINNICTALKIIANDYEDVDIVYPVHFNPNIKEPVINILKDIKNIYLIEPVEYEQFIFLMSKSYIILTDSGGIQEEAPNIGKPVLVMRNTTERPEAVQAGTVKLVGTDIDVIRKSVKELIENKEVYNKMSFAHNPYGDGKASERIIHFIKSVFNEDSNIL